MMKKTLMASAIMAASMGAYGTGIHPLLKPKEHDIDIEEEYKLIQQKKSKLSANARRWVVNQYELKVANEIASSQ